MNAETKVDNKNETEKLKYPLHESTVGMLRSAFEYGFRCGEKGMSWEASLSTFEKTLKKITCEN